MDYYKSMDKLLNLFIDYTNRVPSFGKSFICSDDKNNLKLIKSLKIKNYHTYGIDNKSNFFIRNVVQSKNYSLFDLKIKLPGKKFSLIKIKIPIIGLHNIRNATASIAVSVTLGIPIHKIKTGLKNSKVCKEDLIKFFDYRGQVF